MGKTLRGRSRADEHRTVLADVVRVARERAVDAVVVAGDLFDSASPPPEAEAIVYRTLLDLADDGARVFVVAGNHDNARRLEAVAPLLGEVGVHVVTTPRRPADGGVEVFETTTGECAALAALPFVSQRNIVRSDELMGADPDTHALDYAARLSHVVDVLVAALPEECVRVVLAHAFVEGGGLGGGERSAHTIFDYAVKAAAFPSSLHYVALGHLHRMQRMPAACPVWYCGAPLQLDFGEADEPRSVLVVDAAAGRPASIEPVTVAGGRRLTTLRGTLEQLEAEQVDTGDAWIRAIVREKPRIGLADDVRHILPNCVDVIVETESARGGTDGREVAARTGKSPHELFEAYLDETNSSDPRVLGLFDALLDEVSGAA